MIRYFLENRLFTLLLLAFLLAAGLSAVPFDWNTGPIPRSPVPVDAIPNLGDPQQIVYTEWPGHSPQDIEDLITYPLSSQLLGLDGVKTVRSHSGFGFSSVTLLFDDQSDPEDHRADIIEKLASLPAGLLPDGVKPSLGPDATALGQIFWYTLQGRDHDGAPAGGWDAHELRTLQETLIKPALSAVAGVAEVASLGGKIREYQIELDPLLLSGYGLKIQDIAGAVRKSNLDVGARTLELNRAEYIVRGIGTVRSAEDLAWIVVGEHESEPVLLRDVARISEGPALRRGALSINGSEAAGGVVVARAGENPSSVIESIRAEIDRLQTALPARTLRDGKTSTLTIVPFYDRSELIRETIWTLEHALTLQILVTLLVVMVMVWHLRSSLLIAILLPMAVWISFVWMKWTSVDANIVALAGIAISIGTVVDMGIVLTENMLQHLRAHGGRTTPKELRKILQTATKEVSPAITTALMTTILSFLPVFLLQGEEGRLFTPLAFTKTYVLLSALLLVLIVLPTLASFLFRVDGIRVLRKGSSLALSQRFANYAKLGRFARFTRFPRFTRFARFPSLPSSGSPLKRALLPFLAVLFAWMLAAAWSPAGPDTSTLLQFLFVAALLLSVLGGFHLYLRYYRQLLAAVLNARRLFLGGVITLLLLGTLSWIGFPSLTAPLRGTLEYAGLSIHQQPWYKAAAERFPGLGKEFMPSLDEGAFLLMPTTVPHAGFEETLTMMKQMDRRIAEIPEVRLVAGKIGRAETALDPAPVSMFETLIHYHPEYKSDENGRPIRFRTQNGAFVRDEKGELVPDQNGSVYRLWRSHIQSPDDIWEEILKAANLPGVTSAPKLYPIETRLIMLQTGMRANMGLRVEAPDLERLDRFSRSLEIYLKNLPGIRPATVYADRAVSKPYLEIVPDRQVLAGYGLMMDDVQQTIRMAIGGDIAGYSYEGRERVPVLIRLASSWRDHPDHLARIEIHTPSGARVPLGEIADIRFRAGPAAIRSENTFLTSYVTFGPEKGLAPDQLAERLQESLQQAIQAGELIVPEGVRYELEGEFVRQKRASKRLSLILPITLLLILLLIYRQFRSLPLTFIIFSSIFVVWAGGFIMLWLFGEPWFLNLDLFGGNLRELFHISETNLSVAVWIGFLALFGIAVDDGVIMTTYLEQQWKTKPPASRSELHTMATDAAMRRVRPCLMTTATTLLALLPILTSAGKGSELMIPMAIPAAGGMFALLLSPFFIPLLYIMYKERRYK